MSPRRLDLRAILADEGLRRDLWVDVIIAMQAREGITTTCEQAQRAYDKVRLEVLASDRGKPPTV